MDSILEVPGLQSGGAGGPGAESRRRPWERAGVGGVPQQCDGQEEGDEVGLGGAKPLYSSTASYFGCSSQMVFVIRISE